MSVTNERQQAPKVALVDLCAPLNFGEVGGQDCRCTHRLSSPTSTVPARIVNISSAVTVNEGSNVNLLCLAVGKPEPTVTWRQLKGKGGRNGANHLGNDPFVSCFKAGCSEQPVLFNLIESRQRKAQPACYTAELIHICIKAKFNPKKHSHPLSRTLFDSGC